MTADDRLSRSDPSLAQALGAWLPFGAAGCEHLASDCDLRRFGPVSCGVLGIEATALYAFVFGLAAAWELGEGGFDPNRCAEEGLAALRYCLRTHASNPDAQLEDIPWGGTGMSPKMTDQLALAAEVLDAWLTADDRARLGRVIEHEANANILLPYHLEPVDHGYYRKRPPVPTGRFGSSFPESNAWRANVLGRALLAQPRHEHAALWRESMTMHLVNALSVPADAEVEDEVAGRPLRAWHAGANLHPHFAMEHHGFFHPGYVNRALLSLMSAWYAHVDAGAEPPALLLRHVPEVWDVQRRLLLWDGRLAYPAGDDYPRYCWGQLYLLPVLSFMRNEFGDEVAAEAEARASALLLDEQAENEDGSFFGARLAEWRREIESPDGLPPRSPAPSVYYRTQVDAPFYLGLAAWWGERTPSVPAGATAFADRHAPFAEPDCGLVFHRGERRFASWSWNAHRSRAQGLVIPEGGDHLVEWEGNLVSRYQVRGRDSDRRVLGHSEHLFPGGFATIGRLSDCDGAILQQIAFIALPDQRTCLRVARSTALADCQPLLVESLCLNLANDRFNGGRRAVSSHDGVLEVAGPGEARAEIELEGPWLNVDDALGVVALDGREQFVLEVDGARRACGHSLCYHRVLHQCLSRQREVARGGLLEDCAIALLAGATAEVTSRWLARNVAPAAADGAMRGLAVRGADGTWYAIAINFGPEPAQMHFPLTMEASGFRMLVGTPEQFVLTGVGAQITLPAHGMLVAALGGSD